MQIKIGSKLFVIFLVFKLFWYPNLYANESDLIIEIDNPRFSEKGLDEKQYEIKAEKGLKSGENLSPQGLQ